MRKSLVDHRLLYRLKCSELTGIEFQTFFERIMFRADRSFTAVKAMGSAGDWKCDGYSASTKTVYQCYSPDVLTAAKTCDKVLKDFTGARSHWANQMKRWVFVWNARALPPQVVSLLENLQNQHADIQIDQLGRDKLWDVTVSQLDHAVLNELLGESSSSAEVVARQRHPYYPPLIVSIHGSTTRDSWQKSFAAVMSGTKIKLETYDYGYSGWVSFLTFYSNTSQIDKFYEWYSQLVQRSAGVNVDRYDKRPSIVAAGFGTWILGRAMLKYEYIKVDRIILFDCILPTDFDWATLLARGQVASVRNEVGLLDRWPRVTSLVERGAGTSRSQGFDWFESSVENVFFAFRRSDAQRRIHIEQYWKPFLLTRPSPLSLRHGRSIMDEAAYREIFLDTNVIDDQVFGRFSHFREAEPTDDLVMEWLRVNPDIYTFLIHRDSQQTVGYLNAIPVTERLYDSIRAGSGSDANLPASEVVPFFGEDTIKIYVMSIAIMPEYRRLGDGPFQLAYIQLFSGFVDKLCFYAKTHGLRATHFLTTAWTAEGHNISKHLGMEPVGADKFGDTIYELNLTSPRLSKEGSLPKGLKRLLRMYEDG